MSKKPGAGRTTKKVKTKPKPGQVWRWTGGESDIPYCTIVSVPEGFVVHEGVFGEERHTLRAFLAAFEYCPRGY